MAAYFKVQRMISAPDTLINSLQDIPSWCGGLPLGNRGITDPD